MVLGDIVATVGREPGAADWLTGRDADLVAPAGLHPFLLAACRPPLLVITATGPSSESLTAALRAIGVGARTFPAWETLPHERLSPTAETVGRRLSILSDLVAGQPPPVVVAPVRAVLQPFVAEVAQVSPVRLAAGDEVPLDDLVAQLVHRGYERVELVERRGQFAVRGGIVDVFAPTEDHPTRVEFWGDTVDEMRLFAVADQRSFEVRTAPLVAPVCRELLLTDEVRARAREAAARYPHVADVLEQIAEGVPVEGMESLAPILTDGMQTLLDVLPGGTRVVEIDRERVSARATELVRTSEEFLRAGWHNAAVGNAVPLDLQAAAYRDLDSLRSDWSSLDEFGLTEPLGAPAPAYRGDLAAAVADLRGHTGVLVVGAPGPAQRLAEQCRDLDLPTRFADADADLSPGPVTIVVAPLPTGFSLGDLRVVTEADLTGTATANVVKMPSRRRKAVDPLTLRPGDFVVHQQHGVGRFLEMSQRTVAGAVREYLVIEYAPSKRGQPADRLYVPTDQLDQVTRYVGGEAPAVHRLGGSDWRAAKKKARSAMREIAAELVRLYAARQATKGHAFGPDTVWQRELEDAFPYQETPDQLVTIDEVKADMEKPVPMDRLVCGDVGFGKTEIAVRAAFKAVQDGCQVAVLVPTTLLVKQHQATFSERFASFPLRIEALSRFQTDAEADAVLEGLADGTVDVVIATHRLLSPRTRIPKLGLLIVDEEQRFGVEHKEHIKALRASVDVLSMSATPIPRTLEMAVTGIREISTIQTPPEDRLPVLTFVGAYDDRQVSAAIRRELMRDGQVFFVHNRVESIDRVAAKLAELVPEARVAVAHGQMNEHLLEARVVDFWEGRTDVLVCTTIVESGLDIPNANTLIVDRADSFGLSQLHQLRGRVGRGRERAYAYFLYPTGKPLTDTAHDRLATIAAHTELGSGMAVAMKDLEIRGAGNLLGGEQSGHIANIGFDLYVRMVGEALSSFKGEAPEEDVEVRVELPVNAHIPHDYISDERLRLAAYRQLAEAAGESDVVEAAAEMTDRYGPLPDPVQTLLDLARLRVLARQAGITDVIAAGNRVRLAPARLPESRALRLSRLYPGSLYKAASGTVLVPRPKPEALGGPPVVDRPLLDWTRRLIESVLLSDLREGK